MQEQLLHFIWHRKLYDQRELISTEGFSLEVLHTGFPNQDQGPDFLQSRIRIADAIWAGHVEIHIRSSEWYLHRHEKDTHYNNVILHVVWVEDQPVFSESGYRIPCLELHPLVDSRLLDRYARLMGNEDWVPCAPSLPAVKSIVRISWLERLMSERLESKTESILNMLKQCGGDWEQAFFVVLARQLGAPANSDAMESLALQIPLRTLRRHGDRPDQIEAILFGVAGMLTKDVNDDYPAMLKSEYDFLKKKYGLHTMPSLRWKFMRMRPVHFPTIRIAQLAKIIADNQQFISMLIETVAASEWTSRFMVLPADRYWNTHYHFKSESPHVVKRLGLNTAQMLVINVVTPILFVYGKMQGQNQLKERAFRLLTEMPAEKNAVIQGWSDCGWIATDAGQTQAMLHLKKRYCDDRRCLHCAIGMQVMKSDGSTNAHQPWFD